MTKFTLTHTVHCDPTTFWTKVFFDKEMNEKLIREGLGFPAFELLSQDETDDQIHRRTAITPKVDLPGPVQKALGGNFRYVEDLRFDREKNIATLVSTPDSGKMRTEGRIVLEDAGDGKSRRVIDLSIESKVMLIGGLIENSAEKATRGAYDKGAAFINQWIATKGLGK